jgi:hypothetical protein
MAGHLDREANNAAYEGEKIAHEGSREVKGLRGERGKQ